MIILILLSLFTQSLLASPDEIFQDKQSAAKFLKNSHHSRVKRQRDKCSGHDLIIPGKFETIGDWEKVKDALALECQLPDDEIERLESCVNKCYWKDRRSDWFGDSHEESREAWKEGGKRMDEKPWPCKQCCEVLPKSIFGNHNKRKDKMKIYPNVAKICMPEALESEIFGKEVTTQVPTSQTPTSQIQTTEF